MDTKEALQRLRMLLLATEDPEDKVAVLMAIQALKQPERKKGKWIDMGTYCVCSLCQHTESPQYDGVQPIPNFTPYCSMCGAKMEVEE